MAVSGKILILKNFKNKSYTASFYEKVKLPITGTIYNFFLIQTN